MDGHPHGHRFHKFDPRHAERLTSEDRERLLPTGATLDLLAPRPGQVAADIGCGPGYLAIPLARRLQPGGRVYACDIEPQMLERLRTRLQESGVDNVECVLSRESAVPLPTGSCDLIVLANLLHELAEPDAFLKEVARLLKPGGRGLAVDWAPGSSPVGPPQEVRVSPERATERLRGAGLMPHAPQGIGPYSYAVVFERPTEV